MKKEPGQESADKSVRPYRSVIRQEAAERTRLRILDAALSLYTTQGYARTTIDQIAAVAQVARPTVFSAVGTKAEILKVLRDRALAGDDEPIPVIQRPWYQEALLEADPIVSIRLHARNLARIYQRYAELDAVIHQAAGVDADLADFARLAESQRRLGANTFIRALINKAALRDGLGEEAATDALWALTGSDTYRRLVIERSWKPQDYQNWMSISLTAYLLGTEPKAC